MHESDLLKDGLGDEINAEVEAAMAAIEAEEAAGVSKRPIRGPRVVQAGREHRKGRVVSVGASDVFIEFGPKELGVAPKIAWQEHELPKAGEEVEVVVERYEKAERVFVCARPGVAQKADWEMLEPGQIVEARVTGVTKGGLELEVASHRAFMPASQVSLNRVDDLSVFVGEKFNCEVERVDRRGKGNIVLSRRKLLEQERVALGSKLRETIAEGQVLEGTVRKIMPFGAFVDLGGLDGLVHLSDMTHDRVGHGEKVVQRYVTEGRQVRVQVLKVDLDNNRLSLGMKQLAEDPFASAANDIAEGAEVSGKVTSIMDYGCFVEIAPGIEGLVHISELAHRRVRTVEDVVTKDQVVRCKVLKVDPQSRRVSLSVKALTEAPAGRDSRPREEPAPIAESPALRKLREKFGKQQFKGGLS